MRTNLTAVLAVWAAIGPMTGIVLGHFLTRSLEEKRWHLDNRTQEYRELLSSLATAYMNMLNFKGGDKDEYFRVERLKMESFRLLRVPAHVCREDFARRVVPIFCGVLPVQELCPVLSRAGRSAGRHRLQCRASWLRFIRIGVGRRTSWILLLVVMNLHARSSASG
jgi:hypothetical protein